MPIARLASAGVECESPDDARTRGDRLAAALRLGRPRWRFFKQDPLRLFAATPGRSPKWEFGLLTGIIVIHERHAGERAAGLPGPGEVSRAAVELATAERPACQFNLIVRRGPHVYQYFSPDPMKGRRASFEFRFAHREDPRDPIRVPEERRRPPELLRRHWADRFPPSASLFLWEPKIGPQVPFYRLPRLPGRRRGEMRGGTVAEWEAVTADGRWTSLSIAGRKGEIDPFAVPPLTDFVRDEPDEVLLRTDVRVHEFDDRLAWLTARLGPADETHPPRYPNRRRFDPYARPAGAGDEPVRFPLYDKETATGLLVKLDVLHRPAGGPVLDVQVHDGRGRGRQRDELIKRLDAAGEPYRVWDGDPWGRYMD